MFELMLKWPTVSHTVQTASQRLRRLLRRLVLPLAVAAVMFFGVALYWNIAPPVFDLREVALRQSGGDPKKLVPGAVTTATLIEVATTLLEKKGGFLSNDINPVSLWLDNMPNWEFGALVQVRDFARGAAQRFRPGAVAIEGRPGSRDRRPAVSFQQRIVDLPDHGRHRNSHKGRVFNTSSHKAVI